MRTQYILRAATAVIGFALGTATLSANADQLADVQKAGVITLATDMHYQPFDFVKDNQHVGFDKELWIEIGKEMKVTPKFLDLPWTTTLPGLQAKRFDMVNSPVVVTKERMTKYHFTLPFADATVALLKRANETGITKPEDFAGKRVASQRGTSQQAQLEAYAKTLNPPAKVSAYLNLTEAYADLANGRIDGAVDSITLLESVAQTRPDTFAVVQPSFGPKAYFAYLARKGPDSDSLVAAVNDAIRKIEQDGRMEALQVKWFGAKQDVPTGDFEPNL
ncbi:transporter substrate-binding domain-containing protein [Castellaniella caeni]|uniref:transporter substrate-binding domain-containing protein n=1 Tax=Castellaniella caeni TaxID=266123 RepID=UPI00082AA428|nr:transporter substrate-binding domain-containing protein [Castellaniella caeni]